MVFPTIEFAAFFVVVLLASWLVMPMPKYWKPFIFFASLAFYAAADWRWVFLLVASIVGNQAAATVISKMARGPGRKAVLITAIVGNLALFGVFKYLGFFVESVNGLVSAFGFEGEQQVLELALPIGISFFTFQAISYVVDVYRARRHWPNPSTPRCICPSSPPGRGPDRAGYGIHPQLATPRSPRNIPVALRCSSSPGTHQEGRAGRLPRGQPRRPGVRQPTGIRRRGHRLGDSGLRGTDLLRLLRYTDIAIGIAMLLGFWFPQNFDQPYRAASLQEFWHRWHMTLSRWLRDYLYIPLGGSRKGPRRTTINLMITMVLGGLWHGAAWTFVVWGALHGSGLAFERWVSQRLTSCAADPRSTCGMDRPRPLVISRTRR